MLSFIGRLVTAVIVCSLIGNMHCLADEPSTITPEPAIQKSLDRIAAALVGAKGLESQQQMVALLFELDRATKDKRTELVRQLIWFDARATDVAAGMTPVVVASQLKISRGSMVDAIAPLIGRIQDPKLAHACLEIADAVERSGHNREYDYSYYESYIEGKLRAKREFDAGLVQHMFRRSPGQALQAFTMVVYQDERRKPLLWARHVVDDLLWKRQFGFVPQREPDTTVTQELAKMAEHDEWWARLYAAEIVRQNPELGTPDLVKRLQADKHPLVQGTRNQSRTNKSAQ